MSNFALNVLTGEFDLVGTGGGPSGTVYSLTPYIVGTDVNSQYTTIAAAVAAAIVDGVSSSNPKNIYVKPKSGGWIENIALVDGINIIGFNRSTEIFGKFTMAAAGQASISACTLVTNSDYIVEVNANSGQSVVLDDCYIDVTNANAFHYTVAGGLLLRKCDGNVSGSGFTYFVFTAGGCAVDYCIFGVSTPTPGVSTFDNAALNCQFSLIYVPIATTNNSSVGVFSCTFLVLNQICLNINGGMAGVNLIQNCRLDGGTAPCMSIGGSVDANVTNTCMASSNATVITGAGTLKFGFIAFYGPSSAIDVAIQTPLPTLI